MSSSLQPTEAGSDPYLAWTRTTGWAGHSAASRSDARIPVLIELQNRVTKLDELSIVTSGLVDIPGMYRQPDEACKARYCTATIARDRLGELAAQHDEVERFEFALPVDAGPVDQAPPPDAAEPLGEVVVGVIDRGCAFLHENFRESWAGPGRERTRIAALWDQSRRPETGTPWRRPVGVGYGRELDAQAINELIAEVRGGKTEESIYRDLNHLLDPSGEVLDRVHGTHVLDTVAGLVPEGAAASSSKPAQADEARRFKIIFVSIPSLAPGDSTGASSGAFLLDAVRYILHRAGSGARVVINMSVGVHGGPHDGSSLTDLALDEILRGLRHNIALTVAAGNSAEERWSSTDLVATGSVSELIWTLLPSDTTDSFLELWWATKQWTDVQAARLSIRVVPPNGLQASGWVAAGQTHTEFVSGTRTPLYMLVHHQGRGALGNGPMALLAVSPTAGPRGAAFPGRWKVLLNNPEGPDLRFDAWIQRDEPPYGTRDIIQSSFDDFAETRQGEGCALNNLACGPLVISVGAARLSDGQESRYSGRMQAGRQSKRPAARQDVDLLAPADESATAIGLFAAAVRSGFATRMGGTSVAAPVLARKIADAWLNPDDPMGLQAAGPSVSAAEIKARVVAWATATATAAARVAGSVNRLPSRGAAPGGVTTIPAARLPVVNP